MELTCPCCKTRFPLQAGFLEADGLELAALYGALDPDTARAMDVYLMLFKPKKTCLSNKRALTLASELAPFILNGRFKRSGESYAAAAADWAAAMDKLVAHPPSKLPLKTHGYLVEVVIGTLADRINKERAERDDLARELSKNEGNRFTEKRAKDERVAMPAEISAALASLSESMKAPTAAPAWGRK